MFDLYCVVVISSVYLLVITNCASLFSYYVCYPSNRHLHT